MTATASIDQFQLNLTDLIHSVRINLADFDASLWRYKLEIDRIHATHGRLFEIDSGMREYDAATCAILFE
jgi:hypothetical protein